MAVLMIQTSKEPILMIKRIMESYALYSNFKGKYLLRTLSIGNTKTNILVCNKIYTEFISKYNLPFEEHINPNREIDDNNILDTNTNILVFTTRIKKYKTTNTLMNILTMYSEFTGIMENDIAIVKIPSNNHDTVKYSIVFSEWTKPENILILLSITYGAKILGEQFLPNREKL